MSDVINVIYPLRVRWLGDSFLIEMTYQFDGEEYAIEASYSMRELYKYDDDGQYLRTIRMHFDLTHGEDRTYRQVQPIEGTQCASFSSSSSF